MSLQGFDPAADAPTVSVVVDEAAYAAAASAFSQRVLDRLVASLARLGLIALDDEETTDRIYDIAFNLFATFEDHQGVSADGSDVALLAFADRAIAPERLVVAKGRTALHGGLDDPAILLAIEKARGLSRP